MKRPVMDPMFAEKKRRGESRSVASCFTWVLPLLKLTARALVSNPLAVEPLKAAAANPRKLHHLFLAGVFRQIAFVPAALVVTAGLLVFAGTHPSLPPIVSDPNSQGVYFEAVSLASEDGTRLGGWLVPAVDARRVLDERDRLLRERRAAIVLVHDFGQTPQQMLPLLAPLHDQGIVVLVLGLRGAGAGRGAGQTFGINEAMDVRAAVEMLRRRPFVDPDRVAVLGFGTGASAALLALERDTKIAALVLADPVDTSADAVARRIGPSQAWMAWLRPVCKWAFELSYHVNADDVNYERFVDITTSHPTLRLPDGSDRPGYLNRRMIGAVQNFLHAKLRTSDDPLAATQTTIE